MTASVKQTADAAVTVEAAWRLRPSEDEALRAADIGASGVSEVWQLACIAGVQNFAPLCRAGHNRHAEAPQRELESIGTFFMDRSQGLSCCFPVSSMWGHSGREHTVT